MVKNKKVAASVFLAAFALGLNAAGVTPILGVLKETYAEYGTTMVQLLQSVPYLLIIIGALILGRLTTKFPMKTIALFALAWVGIFGFLPMFVDRFEVLFICRVLIGLGFGILSPFNTVIIAQLFEPQERASYIGMHVVGMSSGAILGNMLGGVLAGFGYHYFYLIYVIAFICLVGEMLTIPNIGPMAGEKVKKAKLNGKVFAILTASLFQLLLLDAFSINVGIYMAENISGSTAMVGLVITVNAVFGMLTGIFFAKLVEKIGLKVVAIVVLLCALGYLAILVIPGMAGVFICSITGGICRSGLGAGFGLMITNAVAKEATAKASGLNTVVSSLGGLMAPTILGTTSKVMFGANTATNQLTMACIGMAILGVILWVALSGMLKPKSGGKNK